MKKANEMRQLPSQEEILSMTGLEFMEKIKLGELPGAPIAKTLNYDLISVSLGQVIFRGAPKFDSMNPVGSVHGGWYGTLLDSAMACAVMTKIPKGSFYTTLEYKINIVKAILNLPLRKFITTLTTIPTQQHSITYWFSDNILNWRRNNSYKSCFNIS